jgi:hypothetical protein
MGHIGIWAGKIEMELKRYHGDGSPRSSSNTAFN